MKKSNKSDFVGNWDNVIRNMKQEVEYYYLKTDTERKQPYKATGIREDFESKKLFVQFNSTRTNDPQDYVLERDRFLELFVQVIEEI